MAILTTKLSEFLIDVMKSDLDMTLFFSDDFYEKFFYFFDNVYENPTTNESDRVRKICGIEDEDRIREIWIKAISEHYERTYMSDYEKAILNELETVVQQSFLNLTVFFSEELEEAGLDLKQLPDFNVELDWKEDTLTIDGDLTTLEIILIEILRGEGCRYEDLEEFIEFNGSDQEQRIKNHLHHLGEIESIYGTIHDFFIAKDLCELDRYRIFGEVDATDEELKIAMQDLGY